MFVLNIVCIKVTFFLEINIYLQLNEPNMSPRDHRNSP